MGLSHRLFFPHFNSLRL
jgi:hypothetical protein